MGFQELVIILIIVEVVLILISLQYLYRIRATSKDFASIFGQARVETARLLKEIQQLSAVTSSREDNILNVAFHLEDIEANLKILINEFRIFAKSSNIVSKAQE